MDLKEGGVISESKVIMVIKIIRQYNVCGIPDCT